MRPPGRRVGRRSGRPAAELQRLQPLPALPPLVRLLEPLREVKDLHLTNVRNENAYYCCTAQLAASTPLPLPTLPPLYVAGDSHSLAPAWRTVSYLGRPHLLRPALATGCKIWHLRKESDFFPRANFESMIASIPPGSPVVFCFGEIDCREGLLVAVERDQLAPLLVARSDGRVALEDVEADRVRVVAAVAARLARVGLRELDGEARLRAGHREQRN